ncbi:hypothetical protein [Noviherbaspirillum saxi]|nr:hypothetical protein [Noviherbaspirillum saxi]
MKALQRTLCFLVAAGAFAASCAVSAQQAGNPSSGSADPNSVVSRFPAGSIKSIEMADTALADANRERAEIQARFAQEEQACHPKFFASSCVEDAKERRRRAQLKLRPVEIEANTFKRQARVTARDEALATKRQKDAAAGIDRDSATPPMSSTPPTSAAKGNEAVQEPSEKAPKNKPKHAQGKPSPDRAARHESRQEQARAEEEANAAKRAQNIADYEKKVKASEQRQQEIARRKAEKQQKVEEKRQLKNQAAPAETSPSAPAPVPAAAGAAK